MPKINAHDIVGGFERTRPGGWSKKATRPQKGTIIKASATRREGQSVRSKRDIYGI